MGNRQTSNQFQSWMAIAVAPLLAFKNKSPNSEPMNRSRKEQWVDLHTHTNRSDGTLSPKELIHLAMEKEIEIVAITDHDTVAGANEGKVEAEKLGIRLINGIEISTKYSKGALHILGYGIDVNSPPLLNRIADFQKTRKTRNERIIDRLKDLGIRITLDQLLKNKEDVRSFGRPHIATVLIRMGFVANMDEAFVKYLGKGGKAFIGKEVCTSKESIDLIHTAGGKAFLAHPSTLNLVGKPLNEFLSDLKQQGLDGVEVYSSSHDSIQIETYQRLCDEMDLLISAGSDFHGNNKAGVQLGLCRSGERIPADLISEELF